MKKVDDTVRRESVYIAVCIIIGSVLMESVFLILGKWNITVLLGNILSGLAAGLNFFLMGLTVQRAVAENEKRAAVSMRLSQTLRLFMLFAFAAVGVALPCFNSASSLIPLFFPRIAIALRPLFNGKTTK